MFEFKIESRLPLALFRKAPFIYSGPDFVSFPLGMISNIIDYRGRRLQRFYPLTVSKVLQDNILVDQMFCFSFFYVNDENDLILFLTHPYWFNRSSIQESFDFFLTKVEELAKSTNSEVIEVEFHDKISSLIAFPTSLSHFSYDLSRAQIQRDDLSLFQQNGFREEGTILCYEQNINEAEKKAKRERRKCNNYAVNGINQEKFITIEKKLFKFPMKAYNLSSKDLIMTQRLASFFSDTISVVYKRSKWFTRGALDGFLQWSPNLMEPFKNYSSPVPFLFYYIFNHYPFKCGKIFNWALRIEDTRLFTCLLSHTLRSMKQKGLKKCQITNVDNEQTFMKNMLELYGFVKIHSIKLLTKRVV